MGKEKEKEVNLVLPAIRPTNGRIVVQKISVEKFVKSMNSPILLPKDQAVQKSTDNRASNNPDADKEFYIVGMAPEVFDQIKMFADNFMSSKEEVDLYVNYQNSKTKKEKIEIKKELDLKENENPMLVFPEIGDKVILSPHFEPITYYEGKIEYGLIHWQDILGVIPNKK